MKTYITLLIFLFSTISYGQNPLIHRSYNQAIPIKSQELTVAYQEELELSEDQVLQFKNILERSLVLEDKIRMTDAPIERKIKLLRQNRWSENKDMRNIMTRIQFRKYKKIKNRIQPLDPAYEKRVSFGS